MSDAVPKENAKIEMLSTSIKVTHTCGCVLVEHFACGEPTGVRKEEDPEKYERLLAERKYHVELCNTHKFKSKAKIIKTDGTSVEVQPANGRDFTLEEMQAIVGGDIELVYLNDTEIMVVNEEGKIDDLDDNHAATLILEENYPDTDDYIVGDVLVCDNEQIR